MAQDKDQWSAGVNTVMECQVSRNAGNFLHWLTKHHVVTSQL